MNLGMNSYNARTPVIIGINDIYYMTGSRVREKERYMVYPGKFSRCGCLLVVLWTSFVDMVDALSFSRGVASPGFYIAYTDVFSHQKKNFKKLKLSCSLQLTK